MALTAIRRAVLLFISLMTIAFFTIASGQVALSISVWYLLPIRPPREPPRSARSKAAAAVTRATTPAPASLPAVDTILSTRLVIPSAIPAGRKPLKIAAASARITTTINIQTSTMAPLRPPSKRARRPATYPPKKNVRKIKTPSRESRYYGGPDLPARKIRRDAEGDEHEPDDGREDRPENDSEYEPEKARQPVDTPVHVPEPVLTLLRSLEVTPRVGCRVPGSVRVARWPDNTGLVGLGRPFGNPPGLGGRRPLSTRPDPARGLGAVLGRHPARLIVLISEGCRPAALLSTLFRPVAHRYPLRPIVGRNTV